MKIIKVKPLVILALATIGFSQNISASTIQVIGSFSNPTSTGYMYDQTFNQDNDPAPSQSMPANTNAVTDSVAYFGWGIDWRDSFINHHTIQSHFWFNGTGSVDGSTATTFTLGEAFSLGSFNYTNEQTVLSGGYVEIDFNMNILVDGVPLIPSTYRIGIDNTPNDSVPAYDTATLLSGPESILFYLDSAPYLLTFNGFTRDSGATFETYANLEEGAQTSAEIFATITAIPVPAAAWLFASGLLTLIGVSRRTP